MPSEKFDGLVGEFLDGTLDAGGARELAAEIERDQAAAGAFEKALAFEALLVAAHREPPELGKVLAGLRGRPAAARLLRWPAWPLVAAAALLAVAVTVYLGLRSGPTGGPSGAVNQVLAGSVAVGGVEARSIPDGSRVAVIGASDAAIRLTDGSEAVLRPASIAVLRGPQGEAREVVDLERGAAGFKVKAASGEFKVATPVGSVRVTGTEFNVELRPSEEKKGESMSGKIGVIMFVAVVAGSVQVDFQGRTTPLSIGQSMAFGSEGKRDGDAAGGKGGTSTLCQMERQPLPSPAWCKGVRTGFSKSRWRPCKAKLSGRPPRRAPRRRARARPCRSSRSGRRARMESGGRLGMRSRLLRNSTPETALSSVRTSTNTPECGRSRC